jgi:hypothetical protein
MISVPSAHRIPVIVRVHKLLSVVVVFRISFLFRTTARLASVLKPSALFLWAEVTVLGVKRRWLFLVLGVMPRLTLWSWVTRDEVPCILGSFFVSLLLRTWTLERK